MNSQRHAQGRKQWDSMLPPASCTDGGPRRAEPLSERLRGPVDERSIRVRIKGALSKNEELVRAGRYDADILSELTDLMLAVQRHHPGLGATSGNESAYEELLMARSRMIGLNPSGNTGAV